MILELIYFLIYVILLWLVYRLVVRILSKFFTKKMISVEFLNGIKIILKIFVIFLLSIGLLTLIQLPKELIISISSVSGIIIGFASTEVMSQIVAGIYLITTHSFGVNDLVNIQGTEGIVSEIGVNYTSIQKFDGTYVKIPNKKIMDSQIRNYTISVANEIERIMQQLGIQNKTQNDLKNDKNLTIKIKEKMGDLVDFIFLTEITRYTFLITAEFSISPPEVIERLKRVCNEMKNVYGFTPTFSLRALGWRATIEIQIYCSNPCVILNNHPKLITEIGKTLYPEEAVK